MKIAVDAMGGDYAPRAVVEGAVKSVREDNLGVLLLLVGDKDRVKTELLRLDAGDISSISVIDAPQVIGMDELPVLAIRKKKDSSVLVSASLLKDGTADAIVTAGNTGAAVVAVKIKCRSLPGVERPAIAAVMPSPYGVFLVLDVGATPDCKPVNLFQFALMGDIYAKKILNIVNPKIGILSLGTEESKGTDLTREAFRMLQKTKINFVGNVEGSDLFTDKVDVIVCDGFVGNVVLKVCESLVGAFQHITKEEIMKHFWAKVGALLMKPTLKRIGRKVHYAEYGGAPLLGINGNCIISHGRSSAEAIKNAIRAARNMVVNNVNNCIIEAIAQAG